jgi:hypothetical protein
MNLDKKLLVCESMLARLDMALESAEAEVECSEALKDRVRSLLAHLKAEQERLDKELRKLTPTPSRRQEPVDIASVANENFPGRTAAAFLLLRLHAVQERLTKFIAGPNLPTAVTAVNWATSRTRATHHVR